MLGHSAPNEVTRPAVGDAHPCQFLLAVLASPDSAAHRQFLSRAEPRMSVNLGSRRRPLTSCLRASNSYIHHFCDIAAPLPNLSKMLTPVLRRQILRSARQTRCFTSSPIAAAQEVKRLGVIGAGQMVFFRKALHLVKTLFLMAQKGLGIALVAAQKAGVPVTLVDTSQASIDKGLKFAGS